MANNKGERRGNHEASYREKIVNGITYIEGRITINGKSYSRYAKTKQLCRDKIDKLRWEGPAIKPEQITVSEWLDKWLDEEIEPSKKETTYNNYKSLCTHHLKPSIGKIKLLELKRSDVQKMINKKDKMLSPRTLRLMIIVLSSALKMAVKDEVIDKNAASLVSLPKSTKKEKTWIGIEEIKKILEVDTTKDTIATAIKVSLLTGLRRGEVLALKWSDIDFKNSTLRIERAIIKKAKGTEITTPKTDESNRTVPLPDIVIEILNNHRNFQKEQIKEAGVLYKKKGYIFAGGVGQLLYPDSTRKGLKRILAATGLPDMRVHDLRHSYASTLFEHGIEPKTIQKLLGHSEIGVTLNTYVHLKDKTKKEAVQKIDDLLSDKTQEKNENIK